jgi:hypothetical protein
MPKLDTARILRCLDRRSCGDQYDFIRHLEPNPLASVESPVVRSNPSIFPGAELVRAVAPVHALKVNASESACTPF